MAHFLRLFSRHGGSLDDTRLAEIFAREVLAFLVGWELLSPEWAERLLSWRHTGFSVHSLVRAKTKSEAERVGKYMIRPVLSLERLSLWPQRPRSNIFHDPLQERWGGPDEFRRIGHL